MESNRNCYDCPEFRTNIEIRELRKAFPDDENNPYPLDVEWTNCLSGPDVWLNCRKRRGEMKNG